MIDLPGQPTLVNGQPPRGATALRDGDVLSIGQVRFLARVAAADGPADDGPGASRELGLLQSAHDLARMRRAGRALATFGGLPVPDGRPFPIDLIPPDSRNAVLGWMLGALHAGQTELIRRQDELQQSVVAIIQHLQSDAAARQTSQEERIDRLAEELRRLAAQQGQAPAPPARPPRPAAPPARPAPPPRARGPPRPRDRPGPLLRDGRLAP